MDDIAGGSSYQAVFCRCGAVLAMKDQFTLEVNSVQAFGSIEVKLSGPRKGEVIMRCKRCKRVRLVQNIDEKAQA